MIVVVDASLACKWMLWEADSRDALRFLAYPELQACGPDLLFVEVAGAIVRRANENKTIAADALEALRKWTVAWGDHIVQPYRVTQRRLFEAGKLAVAIGHPLKDCIYLALAIEFSCPLVTCDEKFAAKTRSLYPDIRLLREFVRAADPPASPPPD